MAPKAPVVSEELCIVTEVAPEQSSAKDSDAPGEYPIGCEVFREVLEHPTDRDTEALRVDSGQIEESTKRPQRQSTKNPPDPSTDLDETIGGQCSKGSQIMKSCPVQEDERNGMFPTDIIGITRGKGGKLGVEVITHGIYKYKCGFRTDRPVRWAEALETIVTNGRWDYTLNENQYTVCVIKVPFSAGIVNVEITLTTGLICVSATNYETWISSIFEPWRSLTVDGIAKPIEPFSDQTNDEEAKDPKGEVEERDIRNDVERLWEEHRTLKTAFSTLESTVNTMNVNIQNLTKSIETMKKSQIEESQLSARKTDTRIMALIGTASDDCDGQIKTCKKELRAEIQKQRLQIEKQEARFQSITDTLRNKLGDTTKELDVPTIEKSPSIPVNINQEQLSRIDRNVQNLQQQIENHLTSITMMHSERNEQPVKEQMAFTSTQTDPSVNSLSSYSAPRQPESPITNIGPKDPVREVPLYVWMDSNGNNIKPDKFWRDSTEYNTTYRISDIHKELDKNKNTKIGCILIGCGVNDIEQKNGREVGEEMIATVERIRREHPTTKIVLGEITPYNEHDAEVITCNGVLRNRIQGDMIQLVMG